MKKGIRRCIQCRTLNDRRLMLCYKPTQAEAKQRSIYVCHYPQCIQRACKNRRLSRQIPGLEQWLAAHLCDNDSA